MSTSSNDIGYTKLIEIDIENEPNLLTIASKSYTLPLEHQEWVRKESKDPEKVGIIQTSLFLYASLIVVHFKNVHRFFCARDKKTLCQL